MSYLDLPRLHFSGLFFTNPNTINNTTDNYTADVPLTVPPPPPGQYEPVAGWNPAGVAQWWLEECTVLSALGTGGAEVDASDAVIGALVQSPSPTTPISDGQGGFYDIAKMVDLDPDQQGRSALYGLRIAVTLPNGAGLQGLMTVPEIRQLNPRIAGAQSSWGFVCNWMGTLQDVQWSGDISGSPLLEALQAAAGTQGLAVKLTVDLHQNFPGNASTTGDKFLYGRVFGSIGPALVGELAQVLPGRCLQQIAPPPTTAALSAAVQPGDRVLQGRDRVEAQTRALGALREALTTEAAEAAPPDPWNPAFAIVRPANSQNLLSIDIGGSIFLNATSNPDNPSGFSSDGTFEVDSGIVVGICDPRDPQTFTPFTNGAITISPQYQLLESSSKTCKLVKNSGVFTFALTEADGTAYEGNPLAIQVNGTTVAAENPEGWWMDVSVSAQRMECGSGQLGQTQIMVRQFGNAVVGVDPPVTAVVQVFQWIFDENKQIWTNPNPLPVSTDVGIISMTPTDDNGLADITIAVNVPDISNLPLIRQPLDSQIYFISLTGTDPANTPVGDGQSDPATFSVLLWKAFTPPANPTWDDIGLVFSAYARLYPGMKAIFDISDEAKVKSFAPHILGRMNTSIADPAYMPVTRDLAPSKMAMIVSWLTQNSHQQTAADAQPERLCETRIKKMSTLTYALQFYRPPGSAPGDPLFAPSINIATAMTPEAVTGTIEQSDPTLLAKLTTHPTFNPDGSFTETGTIIFGLVSEGDPSENNLLNFTSIRLGQLNPDLFPESNYTPGTVMWQIDEGSGTGFFAGATGAITSNFLVDKNTNELIAYQFGVLYLP
jgi:hypothetical protein